MPTNAACHAAVALGYRGKQIDKAARIIDRAIAHPAQERPTSKASELAVEARTPQSAGKSTGETPGQHGQSQEPGELQFAYPRVDVDLPDIDPREPYDDVDEARAVVAGDWGAD